jgi:hypothetical protein
MPNSQVSMTIWHFALFHNVTWSHLWRKRGRLQRDDEGNKMPEEMPIWLKLT